jgi:hypothetical protein
MSWFRWGAVPYHDGATFVIQRATWGANTGGAKRDVRRTSRRQSSLKDSMRLLQSGRETSLTETIKSFQMNETGVW